MGGYVPEAGGTKQGTFWSAQGRAPEPLEKCQTCLLRLQSLDISDQVGDSLLNLTFMPLTDAGEQRTPHRHILAAVGRCHGLSLDHSRNVRRRILSPGLLRQKR